jgi:hypothetical protein
MDADPLKNVVFKYHHKVLCHHKMVNRGSRVEKNFLGSEGDFFGFTGLNP